MTRLKDNTEVLPRTGDSDSDTPPPPAELTEALAEAAPRRWWNRTTLVLAGVALLICGFLGGVGARERWGTTSAAPVTAGPSMPPAAGTAGKVKLVDGTTLYLETASGTTVTVRTSDTTTVKVAQPAALSSLTAGQQVTVQGSADAEGVVTATSVTGG
ncbi:DUF5666 domain-containing protein [Actinoplanes aureus]|uniref:DUF5666 domain-containing protein n=1 Tax=Actinoplanes aureus TaxID=2792083 RepID=A0A931FZ20_9ACTN|nr:DUF5666 domain-containing protein [Actinoplanes aureus]MBG0562516.1 hypothetical protein [Actinoplanes aureus]